MQDSVWRFAASDLGPRAAEFDESEAFVGAHLPGLAALGIMGLNLPEEWGGAGASAAGLIGAVAEIAKACAATASMVTAHFLATDAILLAGSAAQKGRYLRDAAAGKTLGAFALTEPGAGSSPADMSTRAAEAEGAIHLTGVKHFISNAGVADFIIVFARGAGAGPRPVIDAFTGEGYPGAHSQPRNRQWACAAATSSRSLWLPHPGEPAPGRRASAPPCRCSTAAGSRWPPWRSASPRPP
jgi:alkylation response protein AidB-like acyl-CoA dehydrogenase